MWYCAVDVKEAGSRPRVNITGLYLEVDYRCRRKIRYCWIMYDSIILGITKFKTNAPWEDVSGATPRAHF